MAALCRIGDLNEGSGHTGNVVTGSPTVFANGIGVARIGDRGYSDCDSPPKLTVTLVDGSLTVFANGIGVARLADLVAYDCGGTGVMITASASVGAG